MSTIRFDEIQQTQTVKILCKVCRKKLTRVLKSYQTVNPFNKNDDGSPKSRSEVNDSVATELQDMVRKAMTDGLYCRDCQPDPWAKP